MVIAFSQPITCEIGAPQTKPGLGLGLGLLDSHLQAITATPRACSLVFASPNSLGQSWNQCSSQANTRKLASRKLFRASWDIRLAKSHLILWTDCQEEAQNRTLPLRWQRIRQISQIALSRRSAFAILYPWAINNLFLHTISLTPSRNLKTLSGMHLIQPHQRDFMQTLTHIRFKIKSNCAGTVLELQYLMQSKRNLCMKSLPVRYQPTTKPRWISYSQSRLGGTVYIRCALTLWESQHIWTTSPCQRKISVQISKDCDRAYPTGTFRQPACQ